MLFVIDDSNREALDALDTSEDLNIQDQNDNNSPSEAPGEIGLSRLPVKQASRAHESRIKATEVLTKSNLQTSKMQALLERLQEQSSWRCPTEVRNEIVDHDNNV